LYNDETQQIEEWTDIDYKAYFLSSIKLSQPIKGVINSEEVIKYDALKHENVTMNKTYLAYPSYVKQTHGMPQVYENHVKFFQGYIYDKNIMMGMPYQRKDGKLEFVTDSEAEKRVEQVLKLMKINESDKSCFETWARLLEYSAPNFKRASLDLEIMNVGEKIPNAESANLPILCACLASNTGERIALILLRENKVLDIYPDSCTQTIFFSSEVELIKMIFHLFDEYPFIITFNGDDFDLKYLAVRALRLGIPESEIPIEVRDRITLLTKGIHIDLYKFFFIRAMQIYAFQQKYKTIDLDTISKALINKGKIQTGRWVNDLSYFELITYCMRDAELTLELTTFNDNLVMNLMLVLNRMSRMPIENVSRKSVSSWILSFLTYEHRKRNFLIPNADEIKTMKGVTSSTAVVKGKKYKGATVIPPKSGIHFNVKVGDFASLYPSIIKVYNIGYSTINCPHEECKSNTVGELPHWMCLKERSLESMLIGSLRDLRVNWYKKKAKDKELPKSLQTWYGVAEQSIKVIMNASYGVFGSESFEMYCPPAAEEVTAIGRHIIGQTIQHGQELGLEILYGDTDSIFIKNPLKEVLDQLIAWAKQEFDIEFELDKSYRYVCLSERKKNYLGVLEDGFVDVKGLTGKKKHTPPIIKNAFDNTKVILSQVNSEQDMTLAKHKIIDLLKFNYRILKERKWSNLADLAFNVGITKEISEYGKANEKGERTEKGIPQHVRAAKMLNSEDIGIGSSIKFVKVNPKLCRGENVKPLELAKTEDIDVEKYIEYLRTTFEQILDSLNLSFEKDILGVTRMDNWMNQN
jgi:DNA polymerase I